VKKPGEHPTDRVLTVPNALTLLRILAIPVVLVLLLKGDDAAAATLFVLAAVTDFLDGRLARRRGGAGTSHLGTILDPLADKLMLSSVAVVLAVRGLLPAPLVAILVGRDVLTLLGSIVFRGKIRVNRVGKAATAVLMASVAVVMYRPGVSGEILGEVMFYTGLGLSLVAGVLYVGTIKKRARGGKPGKSCGGGGCGAPGGGGR
jgi:CDP-diacylglycerol--glycerol-3-phosphate 3-phosphatidyltransferase